MGAGIAAVCANAGCPVLLLDVDQTLADKAVEGMLQGRSPLLDDPATRDLIRTGSLDDDFRSISGYDWICEVVVEDLETKRRVFEQIARARRTGSIVTSNTSGIPLRSICEHLPADLRRDIAVTHFFNPVKVMRLVELVRGDDTADEVADTLAAFLGHTLGKGVVYARDTVNFIGNRIGCFWMLAGLHKSRAARATGLDIETIDALLAAPVGIPPTGLYGLIDLVGLDVMALVGDNLENNLPAGDVGRAYTRLPAEEQAMLERGQLGRKTGGGFYRLTRLDGGAKLKETFELESVTWRETRTVTLDDVHGALHSLLFADDPMGRFAWDLMGTTLAYAADLVPEIAEDIVNVDRAMRWGFNWAQGPFELLDAAGPARVIERLRRDDAPLPRMLGILEASGHKRFYSTDGREYLGTDGNLHAIPPE